MLSSLRVTSLVLSIRNDHQEENRCNRVERSSGIARIGSHLEQKVGPACLIGTPGLPATPADTELNASSPPFPLP